MEKLERRDYSTTYPDGYAQFRWLCSRPLAHIMACHTQDTLSVVLLIHKDVDGLSSQTLVRKKKIVERSQKYVLPNMSTADVLFRAKIVYLILSKDTDKALEMLSNHYSVAEPKLRVGMPKRYSKNPACYVARSRTIHVSCRDILWNPHVILHEFYHHLRRETDAQGGIEKYANKFAENYIDAYRKTVTHKT